MKYGGDRIDDVQTNTNMSSINYYIRIFRYFYFKNQTLEFLETKLLSDLHSKSLRRDLGISAFIHKARLFIFKDRRL